MRTSALKASQLWKLRGGGAVAKRLLSRYAARLYTTRIDNLYRFHGIGVEPHAFPGYKLELREILMGESVKRDPEIITDDQVDADRFQQGARCYAALWDGRAIDICWAVSNCNYHDHLDGFTMRLGQKDIYLFDYRGIQQHRPPAFCRFRLWSQLVRVILENENQRCGGDALFYSLVSTENRVSNAFHIRKLNAKLLGQLRTRVLLGKPHPILDSDTPDMFIKHTE